MKNRRAMMNKANNNLLLCVSSNDIHKISHESHSVFNSQVEGKKYAYANFVKSGRYSSTPNEKKVLEGSITPIHSKNHHKVRFNGEVSEELEEQKEKKNMRSSTSLMF